MKSVDERELVMDVEKLIQFALKQGLIERLDAIPARNQLLDMLKWDGSTEVSAINDLLQTSEKDRDEASTNPTAILERLLNYAQAKKIIPDHTATQRDLMDARIMGVLMPRQSEVDRRFWETVRTHGSKRATEQFYELCKSSNYIRMDRIAHNEQWKAMTAYGEFDITINLSKPEKDPAEIAALKHAPARNYPKCLLCLENVGYAGRIDHPARQNLRVIPLELDDQTWYMQFSPYVYYNEHSIVFNEEHVPMQINKSTFRKLLQFVEKFPHYFIGSNADLPIVGGSILNHDHFQAGRHTFALQQAPLDAEYVFALDETVQVGRVQWPMSVIRLQAKMKEQIVRIAEHILSVWQQYSDDDAQIVSHTDHNGKVIPHNTITPIARINGQGEYVLDLVLRNNRTSAEHPEGIFHPHRPLHPLKKENIGLIEVMGLAVLPGRLSDELDQIILILTGETANLQEAREDEDHPLHKHIEWVNQLIDRYGMYVSEKEARNIVQAEVGLKFEQVLHDAGVFKRTQTGFKSFEAFMDAAALRRKG